MVDRRLVIALAAAGAGTIVVLNQMRSRAQADAGIPVAPAPGAPDASLLFVDPVTTAPISPVTTPIDPGEVTILPIAVEPVVVFEPEPAAGEGIPVEPQPEPLPIHILPIEPQPESVVLDFGVGSMIQFFDEPGGIVETHLNVIGLTLDKRFRFLVVLGGGNQPGTEPGSIFELEGSDMQAAIDLMRRDRGAGSVVIQLVSRQSPIFSSGETAF